MKEIKAVCFLFSETGTEGGSWAVQEDGFITPDGDWRYEGIQLLQEGDDFTVYAEDGGILFNGIIRRDTKTEAIPRQILRNGRLENDPKRKRQAVGGMWVRWVQKGMDPEAWGRLFDEEKRCLLRRESEK
jgi:hypothetical protein